MRIAVASSADTPFAEKVGRKARVKGNLQGSPWRIHICMVYLYLHFFVDFYGKLVGKYTIFPWIRQGICRCIFLEESIPQMGSSRHFFFWGGEGRGFDRTGPCDWRPLPTIYV